MTAPSPALCPACRSAASGNFCSSCGAALTGAQCASCRAALTPGAKFCHRCGTAAGSAPTGGPATTTRTADRGLAAALPWGFAAIALVALIALVAGQRFGRGGPAPADNPMSAAAGAGTAAAPVDISQMTPEERAERLYDRIMALSERGQADSVRFFAPMAIQAFSMLGALNADQRYDLGRIAVVSGEPQLARAQADTILRSQPTHLLGLLLAADAARLRADQTAEREYTRRFVGAAPTERAKQLNEYVQHVNEIDARLAEARPKP